MAYPAIPAVGAFRDVTDRNHNLLLKNLRGAVVKLIAEISALSESQLDTTDLVTSTALQALVSRVDDLERLFEELAVTSGSLEMQAAVDIDIGIAVAERDDGMIEPAGIDTAAHAGKVLGITEEFIAANSVGSVAQPGTVVSRDDWDWTPGQWLWLSTAGELAATRVDAVDSSADVFFQRMGLALTPTEVLVITGEAVTRARDTSTMKALTTEPDGAVAELDLGVYLDAAATFDAFKLVYETSTGTAQQADTTAAALAGSIIGITTQAATIGTPVEIARNGDTVTDETWTWTPGQQIWAAATAGDLATTRGTGAFSQRVGIALTATTVLVLIGEPVIRVSSALTKFINADPDGLLTERVLAASVVSNDSDVTGDYVDDALNTLLADIDAIDTRVGDNEAAITQLQSDVAALDTRVTTLESDVTTLQGQVAALQSDVSTLQSQVSTLQGQVSTLQGEMSAVQGDVSTLQSQMSAAQATLSDHESRIAALEAA